MSQFDKIAQNSTTSRRRIPMQSGRLTGLTGMTTIRLVQYTTHPDHTADNRARIQAVIAQLRELSPDGFSYTVLLTPETNTFHHLAITEHQGSPLTDSGVR